VEGGGDTCEPWRLARFLHVLGHIAVKQLALVEGIGAAQQRDKQKAEDEREANKGKAKSKKEQEEEEDGLLAAAAGPDAAVADTRAETARDLCERDLLSPDGLVGMFGALVRDICSNASGTMSDPQVRTSAVLALSKLMSVSADYCEENLQLLFSIMIGAPEPEIRSNIVVALGDMAFRWTNLTEPWMSHIYALLRDKDTQVRHNTLTVLTHLVLNDMVKVRGQVSEMALCLEDSDERIQDMARLFFGEFKLKQQGMLLYNLLPDMVGRLSASQVEENKFRRVIKYVFGFIDKAKQTDGLVDKFCQRFRSTDDQRQWRDIAFCLNNLTLSEKGIKKLLEDSNFKAFADKLHDDDIANSFLQIAAKAKKLPGMTADKKDKKDKDAEAPAGSGLRSLCARAPALWSTRIWLPVPVPVPVHVHAFAANSFCNLLPPSLPPSLSVCGPINSAYDTSVADELEQRLLAVIEGAERPAAEGAEGPEGEGAEASATRPAAAARKPAVAGKGKKAPTAKGRAKRKKESSEEEVSEEEEEEEDAPAPAPKKAGAKVAAKGKAGRGKKAAEVEDEDEDEDEDEEEVEAKENEKANVKPRAASRYISIQLSLSFSRARSRSFV